MKELMNERMNDMKKILSIIMLVAQVALPTMAQNFEAQQQQQEWQTSTMQTSGSAYSSQVTSVGATSVHSEATTTANHAPGRPGNVRMGLPGTPTNDPNDPGNVPLGDPVWPLMLMAMLFVGVVYIRRKKALNS